MTTLENQGRALKEEGSKVLVEVSGAWDILVKVFSREGFPSSLASSLSLKWFEWRIEPRNKLVDIILHAVF